MVEGISYFDPDVTQNCSLRNTKKEKRDLKEIWFLRGTIMILEVMSKEILESKYNTLQAIE